MTEGNGMLARLGNVIYWLCTGMAVLIAVIALLVDLWVAYAGLDDPPPLGGSPSVSWFLFFSGPVVAAVVIWFIGRAARYILAGR